MAVYQDHLVKFLSASFPKFVLTNLIFKFNAC